MLLESGLIDIFIVQLCKIFNKNYISQWRRGNPSEVGNKQVIGGNVAREISCGEELRSYRLRVPFPTD